MKRVLHIVLWAFTVLLAACIREEPFSGGGEGRMIDVELSFGAQSLMDVSVTTRATLGTESESKVYNMYVFIFDSNRNKVYGRFFNDDNQFADASTLPDWWSVKNNTTISGIIGTSGKLHLRTQDLSGCHIVAIANIDAEMVNISPEKLSAIQTLDQLVSSTNAARLNQAIVSRSAYFPMTGILSGVTLSNVDRTLVLSRLDAKIQFTVQAADGSGIKSFHPIKWQVFNVPRKGYILERGAYGGDAMDIADASESAEDFFDTAATNFETQDSNNGAEVHGFSFYMMENRKTPIATPSGGWTFQDRDREDRTQDPRVFQYANPFSTYVVITGQIEMDTIAENGEDAVMSADVRYVVHLGDFSNSKWSDFNIFRNHVYTYKIYIKSVNSIRTEVAVNYDSEGHVTGVDTETEPGATGKVVVAKEEVFKCDAHYCSHVVTFHAKNIAKNVTWYVETPFNPKGAKPYVLEDGTELSSEIDCKWVEFRVNVPHYDSEGHFTYWSDERQLYKPRGPKSDTMDISELVKFLREQKEAYDNGEPNLFDNEKDELGNPNPKISVTAFVNEFYYEVNPITKEYEKDLWKRFVNQKVRQMHVLSKVTASADGDSEEIASSFTIQQQSIQTIYNLDMPELVSAWGLENTNDDYESGATKYYDGKVAPAAISTDRGNESLTNGRLNSLKEWEMVDKNGQNSILGQENNPRVQWATYLNLTAPNTTAILRDDSVDGNHHYKFLRWSCLSRNRDNNGNGIIDQDEVRWYMAASNQLMGLFLGGYGIESASRLYQRSIAEQESSDPEVWRQHVIASSRYPGRTNSNNNARVLWAEEGLTGSDISYTSTADGATSQFSTRCVRNLGYDAVSGGDFSYAPITSEPENYIHVKRMKNGAEWPEPKAFDKDVYYIFDCTRINAPSLRYYTDRELVAHDENNEASSLYKMFESASKAESEKHKIPTSLSGFNPQYINQMNDYLDLSDNIGHNPFCPDGYRLCNVREVAVLWSFIPTKDRTSYLSGIFNHSRTHWSFGVDGEKDKGLPNKSWGWTISSEKIIMANFNKQTTSYIRCVRDVKVN